MKKPGPWIAVAVVILLTALLRIHLLQAPLERDEGEYAYAGQLMLQGIPPYLLAYNMKLPGTYVAYALVMAAFGQTIAAIHLGLLLVNAGDSAQIFSLPAAPAGEPWICQFDTALDMRESKSLGKTREYRLEASSMALLEC